MRAVLGYGFVRPFADRLEKYLGVEVVRVTELSTAYSLTVGGRAVIAVPATGNWFRENWDIAHELGHLIMGHHDDGISPKRRRPARGGSERVRGRTPASGRGAKSSGHGT